MKTLDDMIREADSAITDDGFSRGVREGVRAIERRRRMVLLGAALIGGLTAAVNLPALVGSVSAFAGLGRLPAPALSPLDTGEVSRIWSEVGADPSLAASFVAVAASVLIAGLLVGLERN